MKYERLTEKAIGCFGYDLKDFEHKPKEFNDYDAFYAYKMAVKRLGELEDKIEAGALVEVPKGAVVLTPEEREEDMRPCNEERKQLEHRAEVAEKMFNILYEETSEYMKVLSKEWYKYQAEKELAEEKKDD